MKQHFGCAFSIELCTDKYSFVPAPEIYCPAEWKETKLLACLGEREASVTNSTISQRCL